MTQHYVGTKIITAWEEEKDGKPGYAVKYADGYTSWSPKEVFEEAYLPLGNIGHLQSWQQRVIAEQVELSKKIEKLEKALALAVVDNSGFIEDQLVAMRRYEQILSDRISEWENDD